MVRKIIIQNSPIEIRKKMETEIPKSNSLFLKRIDETGFYILSKKNFGLLSMIEKEYYNIKGRLKKEGSKMELSYEVKANSTYKIMSMILPLMMLPTIFLGAAGGDKSNLMSGLMIYLLMSGFVVFIALRQEKKLKRMGERDFELVLIDLNFYPPTK